MPLKMPCPIKCQLKLPLKMSIEIWLTEENAAINQTAVLNIG